MPSFSFLPFFSFPNVSFYFKCYANSQASASASAQPQQWQRHHWPRTEACFRLISSFILLSLLAEAKAKAIPIHSDYSQSKSVSVQMCVCVCLYLCLTCGQLMVLWATACTLLAALCGCSTRAPLCLFVCESVSLCVRVRHLLFIGQVKHFVFSI